MRVHAALLVAFATVALPSLAIGQSCYSTTIRVPNPFMGNGGEVIVMMDGSIWQDQSYQYLYLYQYYPNVILCPSVGIMILNQYRFRVVQIGGGPPAGRAPGPAPSRDVIESQIDGDFEGWDGDTIFQLVNGQIWQQATYSYQYHYAFMPRVLIFRRGSSYFMQVEGVSGTIAVRRLR